MNDVSRNTKYVISHKQDQSQFDTDLVICILLLAPMSSALDHEESHEINMMEFWNLFVESFSILTSHAWRQGQV